MKENNKYKIVICYFLRDECHPKDASGKVENAPKKGSCFLCSIAHSGLINKVIENRGGGPTDIETADEITDVKYSRGNYWASIIEGEFTDNSPYL